MVLYDIFKNIYNIIMYVCVCMCLCVCVCVCAYTILRMAALLRITYVLIVALAV